MEDELNDLMLKAQAEIKENVDKQDVMIYLHTLEQAQQELSSLKILVDEYQAIRNKAIVGLYNNGYSAIQLGTLTKLTRQMIHNIVKGK